MFQLVMETARRAVCGLVAHFAKSNQRLAQLARFLQVRFKPLEPTSEEMRIASSWGGTFFHDPRVNFHIYYLTNTHTWLAFWPFTTSVQAPSFRTALEFPANLAFL